MPRRAPNWDESEDHRLAEMMVDGVKRIWICEMLGRTKMQVQQHVKYLRSKGYSLHSTDWRQRPHRNDPLIPLKYKHCIVSVGSDKLLKKLREVHGHP